MKNKSSLLKRMATLVFTDALLLTCVLISALAVDEDATSATGNVFRC